MKTVTCWVICVYLLLSIGYSQNALVIKFTFVKTNPSQKSKSLYRLTKGMELQIENQQPVNGWYQISIPKQPIGWINGFHFKFKPIALSMLFYDEQSPLQSLPIIKYTQF